MPRQRPRRRGGSGVRIAVLTAIIAGLAMMAGPVTALAHVSIDVGDGQYVMEVGFRDEPAFLGQPNAIFVKVEAYGTGGTQPVDGLASTLEAEVVKDGQTLNLALLPRDDGVYEAPFVPTATGDYTFRISGMIEGAAVDESVTSSPSTFNSVEPMTAIQFPAQWPDPGALQAETAAARGEAAMARTFAFIGIAAGVLGLILAAVALARAGRGTARDETPIPIEPQPATAGKGLIRES